MENFFILVLRECASQCVIHIPYTMTEFSFHNEFQMKPKTELIQHVVFFHFEIFTIYEMNLN